MATPDPLARYNAKRDFTRTAEPAGTLAKGQGNRFMVQKHDATRLHWDLRLEVDGVMKSWAVTRGPSLNPDDKRLAVQTEDHPLSYADFEGTIAAGEYGGGTVMLWDDGTWAPIAGKSAKDLEAGHLHFIIKGERMKGEWMLIRLKPRGKERHVNWLLRKVADDFAGGSDDLVESALTSVKSGRTMEQIATGVKVARRGAKAKLPAFREPQLCTLVDAVPTGNGWIHEVKYDGYRALVAVAGGTAKVFTRSGLDWTAKFAAIAAAAAALPVESALIDGEIVAFKAGKPDFSTLKEAIGSSGDMTLFAFDLLELDGADLTTLPNVQRKQRLRAIVTDDDQLKFSDHIVGHGETLFMTMCREGYEGVVSKRADAPYVGARTSAWLKVKCTHRQEFVIVGWTQSDKGRGFKSLLLGVHKDGTLHYAGKVGTGFTVATMDEVRDKLDRIARKTPTVEAPRAMVRGAQWVEPDLVAEIAFAETTPDGLLRHASFIALRGDKAAAAIVAETAQPTPQPAESAIVITHPERVIFDRSTITKGDLAAYYEDIAPVMLPFAANRPISLVRCPQGRGKHCFFQKHDAGSFGDYVEQIDIKEKEGSTEPYLYLTGSEGLRQCVQMGTIEFHGWGALVGDVEQPDRLIFDLDPDEGLGFDIVKQAAIDLKTHLAEIGLTSFALLSGGKGVHVVVPLTPQAEWPAVKDFADRFSRALAQAEPERFVATMSKAKRKGRIFIDWLRNQRGSTAVMPYSARARNGAPVAVPVTWAELADLETAATWHVGDQATLLDRANTPSLAGWGSARQVLPDL